MRIFTKMFLVMVFCLPSLAMAQMQEYVVTIKDHQFTPALLKIPANQKVKLVIDNQDPTPEEFESHDLNREKIIGGGKKGFVFIGPLKPGKYEFFGEFNPKTANGTIEVE